MTALFSYFSKNFQLVGGARSLGETGGKIGLNVEELSFSQGLSREFFQVVLHTSEHSILHLFWPNSAASNLNKNQKS